MGERGAIPQREENLARPRSRQGGDQQEVKRGVLQPVKLPEPDKRWHPIARMVWDSLIDSGQSDFFQQSDWAHAYSLCDDITFYKTAKKWINQNQGYVPYRSAEMLKAIQAGMSSLLMTEGDRRRVRVELSDPEPTGPTAALYAIDDYRRDLEAA